MSVPIQSNTYSTKPDVIPGRGVGFIPSVNFKTTADHRIDLDGSNNYLIDRVRFVTRTASAISNGASVSLLAIDYADTTEATLTTAMTGANNDIILTSKLIGTAGNAITITLVDPAGNDQALAVTVVGTDISVSLATGGAGAITTTAALLIAAINGDADAFALVNASLAQVSGAGAVTALAETSLAGGLDWVVLSTLVSSTDLADTDSVGVVQTVAADAATTKVFDGSATIVLRIGTGATATTDIKDVFVEYLVIP